MKNYLFVLFISFLFNTVVSTETASIITEWNSPAGIARFQRNCNQEHFWKLMQHYESQIRLNYCGVATAVIALNALSIDAPPSAYLGKFRLFTQEEFFSDQINQVLNQNEVEEKGIDLNDMQKILETLPIEAAKFEAEQLSHLEIRDILLSGLKDPNQCVIGLYHRKKVNQLGEGHWSPIAAYDQESDSFLIMDVSRFKYCPVWINATTFINSMQTSDAGRSRGFIVLRSFKISFVN
jgi:Phytochelatin synthase